MFRPMPVLTVIALLSVIILIQLGNWQYGRYTSKLSGADSGPSEAQSQMLHLTVMRTHKGQVQNINGMADGEFIWRRYVPARLDGSDEIVLALLDVTGGIEKSTGHISDQVEKLSYRGVLLAKTAHRGWFGQADKPEQDTWFRLDAPRIGTHLGLSGIQRVAEPLNLTIMRADNPARQRRTLNPYAANKPIDPLPAERHFGYALTWWGLALGLIGVYFVLHHTTGRLRFRKDLP